MKTVKRIAAVLLAVMLMAPAAVHAAAPSVKQININKKKATATVTYNKKKTVTYSNYCKWSEACCWKRLYNFKEEKEC